MKRASIDLQSTPPVDPTRRSSLGQHRRPSEVSAPDRSDLPIKEAEDGAQAQAQANEVERYPSTDSIGPHNDDVAIESDPDILDAAECPLQRTGRQLSTLSLSAQLREDALEKRASRRKNDAARDTVSLFELDTSMKLSKHGNKEAESTTSASSSHLSASFRPRTFSVRKSPAHSPTQSPSTSPSRARSIRQRARSSQPSTVDDVLNASSSDERRSSDGSRSSLFVDAQSRLSIGPDSLLVEGSKKSDGNDAAASNSNRCQHLQPGASRSPFVSTEDLSAYRCAHSHLSASSNSLLAHAHDCTVFEDCSKCHRHPAQLGVFLNYAWRKAPTELNPILFTVVVDNYQACCTQQAPNAKEVRKWAYEIFAAFLTEQSPLTIVPNLNNSEAFRSAIDALECVLATKFEREDLMRSAFVEVRKLVTEYCSEQVRDFAAKVVNSGFGSLYGAQQLVAAMSQDAERAQLESAVNGLLEQMVVGYKTEWSPSSPLTKEQNDARALLIASMITLAKQYNVTVQQQYVDKYTCFNAKSKRSQFFKRTSSKVYSIRNHQFAPRHFFVRTQCAACRSLLFGIGTQGYQCSVCEVTVHPDCARQISDVCQKPDKNASEKDKDKDKGDKGGEKKKHGGAPFSLSTNLLRKSSSGTPPSASANKHETWAPGAFISPIEDCSEGTDSSDKLRPINGSTLDVRQAGGRRAKSDVDRAVLEAVLRSKAIQEADEASGTSNPAGDTSTTGLDMLQRSPSISSFRDGDRDSLAGGISVPAFNWKEDTDLDVEVDMKPLDSIVPEALLKKMKPKEKELQKVLNELLYTERTHLRNMKLLLFLFYNSWPKDRDLEELRDMVMPNLTDIVDLHKQFCSELQTVRDQETNVIGFEVADVLAKWFVGEPLQRWKDVCSTFCQYHSQGIELLRIKRKKDPRFDEFLSACEAESLCRRLQVKDFIPMQMQRLTKYPLLVEGCMKQLNSLIAAQKGAITGAASGTCLESFKTAVGGMKSVLQTVNDRVRECENQFRWSEIQKRIDRSKFESMTNDPHYAEYKGFSFAKHRMIYDGPLQWRLNKERKLDCHLVLLDSHLLLLRKEDDRLILKSHSVLVADGKDEKKHVTPIISLSTDLYHVREDAREKRGFLLLAAAYMYELCTISSEERRKWIDVIVKQVQQCKAAKVNAAAAAAAATKSIDSRNSINDSGPPSPASFTAPSSTVRLIGRADSNISLPCVGLSNTYNGLDEGVGSSVTNQSILEYEADESDSKPATDAATLPADEDSAAPLKSDLQPEASGSPKSRSAATRRKRQMRKRSCSLGDRSAIARIVALSLIENDADFEEELTRYLERGRRELGNLSSSIKEKTARRPHPSPSSGSRLARHESDSYKYNRQPTISSKEQWRNRAMSVRIRPSRQVRRRSLSDQRKSGVLADDGSLSPTTESRNSRIGSSLQLARTSTTRLLRMSQLGSASTAAGAGNGITNSVELLSDEAFAALLKRTSQSRRRRLDKEVQVTVDDPEFGAAATKTLEEPQTQTQQQQVSELPPVQPPQAPQLAQPQPEEIPPPPPPRQRSKSKSPSTTSQPQPSLPVQQTQTQTQNQVQELPQQQQDQIQEAPGLIAMDKNVTDLDRILAQIARHDATIRVALNEKQRLVNAFLHMQSQINMLAGSCGTAPPTVSDKSGVNNSNIPNPTTTRACVEQAVTQAQEVLAFLSTSEALAASFSRDSAQPVDQVYASLPKETVLQVLNGLSKHLTELLRLFVSSQHRATALPVAVPNDQRKERRNTSVSPHPHRQSTLGPSVDRKEDTIRVRAPSIPPITLANSDRSQASVPREPIAVPPIELHPTTPPLGIDVVKFVAGEATVQATEASARTDLKSGSDQDTLGNNPLQTYKADC